VTLEVVCLHRFTQNYLVAVATSLHKSKNKVHIHCLHPKRFHTVKILQKSVQYIWRYTTKYASFLAMSYQTFTNELCQLWSYCTEVHEIFTWYRDVIYVVNAHIAVAISHSVSKCQSDERGEFAIFFTKLVAMATFLEISEKEVQIDHLHLKRFQSVKRLRKSVQRILR